LRNKVLGMDKRNLVVGELGEVREVQLAPQNRFAGSDNRESFSSEHGSAALAIMARRLTRERHQPQAKLQ
jgi:hypothetical protein